MWQGTSSWRIRSHLRQLGSLRVPCPVRDVRACAAGLGQRAGAGRVANRRSPSVCTSRRGRWHRYEEAYLSDRWRSPQLKTLRCTSQSQSARRKRQSARRIGAAEPRSDSQRMSMRTTALPSKFLVGHLPPERLHEAFHIECCRLFVVQLAHHRDLPGRPQRELLPRQLTVAAARGQRCVGQGEAGGRGGIASHHVTDDHARRVQHADLDPEVADCRAAPVRGQAAVPDATQQPVAAAGNV